MLSRHQPLLLFLCIFGLGLGLFTRHNDFPCYYHPDEFGKAKQLVKGTRNFHHPMLMLTTADWTRKLALGKEGRRDYQAVTVTGRWVTAGFAALGAAALALLAARQYHLLAGWLVGVLAVSNSLIFELAHYFKEDPYLTSGIALTALALHAFQRKPDTKRLCLLAAATSLAAAGKFIGVALLPMVLVAVWFIAGPADPRRRKVGLGYFLLVFALVWAAFNYHVFKPDSKMWSSIGEEMDKAYGNEILNRRHSFGFYVNVQDQNGGWLPPILTGLWLLWAVTHPRRVPAAEWVLAGSSILYFTIFSLTPKDSTRYYLPITASLCYFSVAGIMAWAGEVRRGGAQWAAASVVAVAVWLQYPSLVREWNGFIQDDRAAMEQWIRQNLPADAYIAQDKTANLPELDRQAAKHAGRQALPQRVVGGDTLADVGDLAELRAMGITHAAICYNTYARYVGADGKEVFIRPGTPAAAIQQVYQAVLPPNGIEVWSMARGANGYLQPGLKLIDISGIPAPEKPDDQPGESHIPPAPKPAPGSRDGEE